jgi:hypothetical protein
MERLHGCDIPAKTIYGVEELLLQKQHSRPGVIQNVSEFLRPKPRIQWKQYGAGFYNAVVGFEKPVAIQAQKCDPVTALHPSVSQSAGKAGDPICQLSVCEPAISTHNCGLVGVLLLRIAEESYWGQGNIHYLSRHYQADWPPSTTST